MEGASALQSVRLALVRLCGEWSPIRSGRESLPATHFLLLRRYFLLSARYFLLTARYFLLSARYFFLSYKKIFITKFVTSVTNFVIRISKFVICVTNFVTNLLCAESEKCQGIKKKFLGLSKKYPPRNSGRIIKSGFFVSYKQTFGGGSA